MQIWKYLYITLILILSVIVMAIFQLPDGYLHIVACDVGQGDAILVIYKNIQILTDGGPNNRVLECLSKHVPFWDREIELAISTHPQKDHYFGLIEVFKRYKVDNFLYNNVESGSVDYQVLKKEVGGSGTKVIRPHTGQVLRVGMIYLDILNPDSGFSDPNANNIGVVDLLKFGKFKAIFTADVENKISDGLSALGEVEGVNYLKVNHHGSKNGLSEMLVKALYPQVAVISVGKNNIYGHPHKEILDLLGKYNIRVLRTDMGGDVIVSTDGEKYWIGK
ncbi:MAG: hypothetical protein HYV90_05615 [Candidatus Woesebacteria bacterium]|nr:MAG: hypothetical protein HYV90_05615 [Candidatus Woesebacteria bacterium]